MTNQKSKPDIHDLDHLRSTPGMGWLVLLCILVCVAGFIVVSLI